MADERTTPTAKGSGRKGKERDNKPPEPTTPATGPADVPDVVLEELLAAFAAEDAEAIDFDDPSIDRMLGLGDNPDSTEGDIVWSVHEDTDDARDATDPAPITDALTSSNTVALIPADDDRNDRIRHRTSGHPARRPCAQGDRDR